MSPLGLQRARLVSGVGMSSDDFENRQLPLSIVLVVWTCYFVTSLYFFWTLDSLLRVTILHALIPTPIFHTVN